MILYGPQMMLREWATEQLGVSFTSAKCIGVMRHGEIVAVAAFDAWRHPNIEVSFATTTPAWATRETIRAILAYPFVQLGCKRLTIMTEATNQRARAFALRLGFREEGHHPDALPSGDAVSFGLLACDAARWLGAEEETCERQAA